MVTKLTDWQRQIVSATLLGNGYLIAPKKATNFYLSISENKDKNWLLYKAEELACITANNPFDETESVWKWRSKSTSLLSEFACHYHNNRKVISKDTLELLRDIGIAVWFGDKGYWQSKKKIGLRTSYYGDQNELIHYYFNSVDIECSIVNVAPNRPNIVFSEEGSNQIFKMIEPCLPPFMSYRLKP